MRFRRCFMLTLVDVSLPLLESKESHKVIPKLSDQRRFINSFQIDYISIILLDFQEKNIIHANIAGSPKLKTIFFLYILSYHVVCCFLV
ncbi:hypothetical protein HanPI659440_Chr13g0501641 [Helianthus annuus]|nr:hypothetical protein HanPI659440_Chr13g0501641 [Helianthus annuus]